MGIHDQYGKSVFQRAAGTQYSDTGNSVRVDFNSFGHANIVGTVGNSIAIEIESRVSKQVRGALLDLVLHPYPKKLLALLPVHMNNPQTTLKQCDFILGKFLDYKNYRVVLLQGDGNNNKLDVDAKIVKAALEELGY